MELHLRLVQEDFWCPWRSSCPVWKQYLRRSYVANLSFRHPLYIFIPFGLAWNSNRKEMQEWKQFQQVLRCSDISCDYRSACLSDLFRCSINRCYQSRTQVWVTSWTGRAKLWWKVHRWERQIWVRCRSQCIRGGQRGSRYSCADPIHDLTCLLLPLYLLHMVWS